MGLKVRSLVAIAVLFAATAALLAALPAVAFGFSMMDTETGTVDLTRWEGASNCVNCHGTTPFGVYDKGPHGTYGGTLKRCEVCHEVHVSGGVDLLPRATVKGTCEVCHDGSGGFGVYGTIVARGGTVRAAHRIDTTNAVPGGDASLGGTATATFGGDGGRLGCDDCHSPHDANTITSLFRGDRVRNRVTENVGPTSHLLKKRPTGASAETTGYGSDWCAGCHKGRQSGGAVHNHPTERTFDYSNAAIVSTDAAPSGATTMGPMGRSNRGYLMPFPRTAEQTGHAPICQQCHEDKRSVGTTTSPQEFRVTSVDGVISSDNPRFQVFPHEAANAAFLIETGEDLCTNCHFSGSQLP